MGSTVGATPVADAPAPGPSAWLRPEGEYWTVSYRDSVFRLRDVKGLRYLAILVAHPDVELHAMDLAASEGTRLTAGSTAGGDARDAGLDARPGLGDAGETLDPQAKAQYRRRIEELRSDIEEAEAFNDLERASRGREELEFLARELAAAVGLHGRDRASASSTERARVSVTRAVKAAIRKIGEHEPDLGRHLEHSVRTGQFCCYEPGPELSVGLDTGETAPVDTREPGAGGDVAPGAVQAAPLLSPRIAIAAAADFFGRDDEMELLADRLDRARAGEYGAVMVGAEPGMGKTRLAAELGIRAHAAGVTALYGRCDETLALPYQPFVEAFAFYVEHHPPARVAQRRAERAALARLLPQLADALDPGEQTAGPWPESDRYLLFAGVAGLLAAIAVERPLVLILDDLHAADRDTVLLVKYLLSSASPRSALLVGTYRSTDLDEAHALSELLAELRPEAGVERLVLKGLGEEAVAEMTTAVAGHELAGADADLAHTLRAETSGNPYFVAELLRHLSESGDLVAGAAGLLRRDAKLPLHVPGSLREALSRRVARVGEEATRVLSAAAVAGYDFDAGLVARALGEDEDDILDVLDRAVHAGLVARPAHATRYSFAHFLVADTLYEALTSGSRRRLHRAFARALEALYGEDPGARIGELAHHVVKGASTDDVDRAVDYARRAGDRALMLLAPDEAEQWYARGVELLSERPGRERAGCELLIALGTAQCQSGNAEFRHTLLEAASAARRLDEGKLLVRAALANTRGFVSATGRVDHERVALLEAALAAAGEEDSPERARLQATLAAELTFAGDWRRRLDLSDEALAIARRLGEPSTLYGVLSARFMTIWTPETLAERRANTEEELAIAERHDDPLAHFRSVHWRAVTAIESGATEEAARLVERESQLAEELGQPTARWLADYDNATQALIHGRLAEAERWVERAAEVARASGQPEADAFHAGQLVNIRFEQGRLAELEPLIAAQVEANPGIPGFRAALALARAQAGLTGDARELLAAAAADDFASIPYDPNWLVTLAIYAEACAELGDAAAAEVLHARLEPWRDQVAFNSATAWGAVSRHLGNLDAGAGPLDSAERWLLDAVRQHERMEAPIWLARTRLDLARVMAASSGGGDGEARALAEQAASAAGELGAAGVNRRAQALLTELR